MCPILSFLSTDSARSQKYSTAPRALQICGYKEPLQFSLATFNVQGQSVDSPSTKLWQADPLIGTDIRSVCFYLAAGFPRNFENPSTQAPRSVLSTSWKGINIRATILMIKSQLKYTR
ncbi:hypothetical protein PoB_003492700 [Plakobranchus ocellatus]|uniref:Uncharacterized protein n=1 Tax=Plakobranchus ocellatus TaxID=259542 RepID=A0AAV4AMC8_9GAST|nr:hypothetical protein PoB_003492700 [Plakobranchus ocellatus]